MGAKTGWPGYLAPDLGRVRVHHGKLGGGFKSFFFHPYLGKIPNFD